MVRKPNFICRQPSQIRPLSNELVRHQALKPHSQPCFCRRVNANLWGQLATQQFIRGSERHLKSSKCSEIQNGSAWLTIGFADPIEHSTASSDFGTLYTFPSILEALDRLRDKQHATSRAIVLLVSRESAHRGSVATMSAPPSSAFWYMYLSQQVKHVKSKSQHTLLLHAKRAIGLHKVFQGMRAYLLKCWQFQRDSS